MNRSTDDVARETGVTFRQLDYWARKGYLDVPASGSGRKDRDWPQSEVDKAKLIARLSKAGLSTVKAARVAALIIENPKDTPQRSVRIGNGVWVVIKEEE